MTLSADARAVLMRLSNVPFLYISDVAAVTGIAEACVVKAAILLEDHGLIKIDGPPNGNSDRGYDIDRLSITPRGRVGALRPNPSS